MDHHKIPAVLLALLAACVPTRSPSPDPGPPAAARRAPAAAAPSPEPGRPGPDGLLPARVPSLGLAWLPVWARGLRQSRGDVRPAALSPTSLAVGPHGRAAVGAAFEGLVDLDAVPLLSAGEKGAALVRYSEDGAVLWGRSFAATGAELIRSVAVDYAERVIASGDLGEDALGPDGPAFPPGRPGEPVVVAAFAEDGAGLWAARAAGDLQVGPLAVQRSSHVVLGGSFSGVASLERRELRSRGGRDALLARFAPGGFPLWVRSLGEEGDDEVLAVAAGADGEIGACLRTTTTDRVVLRILRLDSDGELRWTRELPLAPGALDVAGVAFDSEGALLLSGTLRGAADLGGGELRADGESDLALAGYGPGGELLFARLIGGPGADVATGLAVDLRDLVLVAGTFSGELRSGADLLASVGESDWLLAAFSRRGDPVAARRFGGAGADRGGLVAADGTDHVVLSGTIGDVSPFGGSALPGPAGVITQLAR